MVAPTGNGPAGVTFRRSPRLMARMVAPTVKGPAGVSLDSCSPEELTASPTPQRVAHLSLPVPPPATNGSIINGPRSKKVRFVALPSDPTNERVALPQPPAQAAARYPEPIERLHAYVFSDDEDDDPHEHAAWMAGISVVRNKAPSFKVWSSMFGQDSKALRDRGNLRKVKFHLEGNYVPKNLHGAKVAAAGPLIHRYEQRHDCQHLRPPGATAYRAASFFTGAGIMDEASRKAKFVVVCCAEIDETLHEAYYDNTGVQPYPSNEADRVAPTGNGPAGVLPGTSDIENPTASSAPPAETPPPHCPGGRRPF